MEEGDEREEHDYEGAKCSTPSKSKTPPVGESSEPASPILNTPPELQSEPEMVDMEEVRKAMILVKTQCAPGTVLNDNVSNCIYYPLKCIHCQ